MLSDRSVDLYRELRRKPDPLPNSSVTELRRTFNEDAELASSGGVSAKASMRSCAAWTVDADAEGRTECIGAPAGSLTRLG